MASKKKITEFFGKTVVIPSKNKIVPITQKLYFDGGSRGNPGPSGCGYALFTNDNEIASGSHALGFGTNNEAEYQGLIYGLREAKNLNIKDIIVYGDSLLVINQIQGKWQCRAKNLLIHLTEARNLIRHFNKIILQHIPREMNKRADQLANNAMDQVELYNNIDNIDIINDNVEILHTSM